MNFLYSLNYDYQYIKCFNLLYQNLHLMLMSSSILPKKPRRISGTTTQPYIKYKKTKTKVMLTYKYGQNAVDQMSHGFSYFPILGRHTSHHVSLFPYRIRGFGVIQLAGNVSRIHIFMAVPFRTHS